MTTFGDRGHDHLRDDPPLSTADMARAGGPAEADLPQPQATSSPPERPAGAVQPEAEHMTVGRAAANPGPGPEPGSHSAAPASDAGPASAAEASDTAESAAEPAAAGAPAAAAASAPAGPPATGARGTESPIAGVPRPASDDGRTPLFADDRSAQLRARWTDVQAGFVDEPRSAVEQADGLVAEVMRQLASTFAEERTRLEAEWERQGDVSTEDLRQALRRYRSFFDRLLTV